MDGVHDWWCDLPVFLNLHQFLSFLQRLLAQRVNVPLAYQEMPLCLFVTNYAAAGLL